MSWRRRASSARHTLIVDAQRAARHTSTHAATQVLCERGRGGHWPAQGLHAACKRPPQQHQDAAPRQVRLPPQWQRQQHQATSHSTRRSHKSARGRGVDGLGLEPSWRHRQFARRPTTGPAALKFSLSGRTREETLEWVAALERLGVPSSFDPLLLPSSGDAASASASASASPARLNGAHSPLATPGRRACGAADGAPPRAVDAPLAARPCSGPRARAPAEPAWALARRRRLEHAEPWEHPEQREHRQAAAGGDADARAGGGLIRPRRGGAGMVGARCGELEPMRRV